MKLIRFSCITVLTMILTLISTASTAKKPGSQAPISVIVAPAIKTTMSDQIEALGTTKPNESVVITADRAERIIGLYFDDGQRVTQGQLLVTLDKTQEEAELRAQEALTVLSQSAYKRAKNLTGSSALPKATLQERYTELKQAQAATDALKASLLSYEITAPFDGILGFRKMSIGTFIQPGDVITTLKDISQIKVDFAVPSVFLTALTPGMSITGTVNAYGERTFKGTVTTVDTQVDPITRTVQVRAIISNPETLLKPGLLMNIILSKNSRPAIIIPEEALIKNADTNSVFIATQNEQSPLTVAVKTRVTIGSRIPGSVEILDGLKQGDHVIIHGTVKVRDGAAIKVMTVDTDNKTLSELLKQSSTETTHSKKGS